MNLQLQKFTITVVEMQHLPSIQNTESKEDTSWVLLTLHNDRRNVYVVLKTDTEELNIVV